MILFKSKRPQGKQMEFMTVFSDDNEMSTNEQATAKMINFTIPCTGLSAENR